MPPDPIAAWLLSIGLNAEALVFAIVMATVTTAGVVLAQLAATK